MTEIYKWDCYTFAGVAEVLGVAVWRLRYAVDSGYLPGPGVVFKRRALFAPSQLEWIRAYFAREDDQGGDPPQLPAPATGIDDRTGVPKVD